MSQPSRTGAALQDVVGLRLDRGHHAVEIAQVGRRKQHSEQEGNRLSLLWFPKPSFNWHYCGPFRFKKIIFKKSFNPLLAASASLFLFGLTHSGRTKISQNLYIKPGNNCTVPYLTSLSSSSFSGRSRMTSRWRTRLSTDPSDTYCASEIHSGVAIVLNGMFLSAASHQVAHLHHGGCLLLGQQPAGHVLHHAEHLGIGRRDRLPL